MDRTMSVPVWSPVRTHARSGSAQRVPYRKRGRGWVDVNVEDRHDDSE